MGRFVVRNLSIHLSGTMAPLPTPVPQCDPEANKKSPESFSPFLSDPMAHKMFC